MNMAKLRAKGKRYLKRYREGKNNAGFGYWKLPLNAPAQKRGKE